MSRIGKKPIALPKGVSVKIAADAVEVQGPKGKLRQRLPPGIVFAEDSSSGSPALVATLAREDATLKKFGRVDALVNNAGKAWVSPAVDLPLDRWHQIMELNVAAPFLCSQVFGREMIRAKRGKIINIASIAGLQGRNPKAYDSIVYSTSKGALVNFTRDLAIKWAEHNIQVNCICPGFFVTPINQKLFERNPEPILREIPLGRTGGPDDLKGIAVLLASDASAFMTGAIIPVDGGTIAW